MNKSLTADYNIVQNNLGDVQRELKAIGLEREKNRIHEGLFGRKGFMNVMASKQNRK